MPCQTRHEKHPARNHGGYLRNDIRSPVRIYTVGLFKAMDGNRNPEVLQGLADVTGGEAVFPESRKEIQQALHDIAGQIRNQYTLGYYPDIPADGRYHKLSVKVESPSSKGLSAETRPGYFARTDKTGN